MRTLFLFCNTTEFSGTLQTFNSLSFGDDRGHHLGMMTTTKSLSFIPRKSSSTSPPCAVHRSWCRQYDDLVVNPGNTQFHMFNITQTLQVRVTYEIVKLCVQNSHSSLLDSADSAVLWEQLLRKLGSVYTAHRYSDFPHSYFLNSKHQFLASRTTYDMTFVHIAFFINHFVAETSISPRNFRYP